MILSRRGILQSAVAAALGAFRAPAKLTTSVRYGSSAGGGKSLALEERLRDQRRTNEILREIREALVKSKGAPPGHDLEPLAPQVKRLVDLFAQLLGIRPS